MLHFLYLVDFWQSTEWSVTEHSKVDTYEHYAAVCEGHNFLYEKLCLIFIKFYFWGGITEMFP